MSKELKVVMKKQKTTGQKKDIAQDTANTGKYRPAGQQKIKKVGSCVR